MRATRPLRGANAEAGLLALCVCAPHCCADHAYPAEVLNRVINTPATSPIIGQSAAPAVQPATALSAPLGYVQRPMALGSLPLAGAAVGMPVNDPLAGRTPESIFGVPSSSLAGAYPPMATDPFLRQAQLPPNYADVLSSGLAPPAYPYGPYPPYAGGPGGPGLPPPPGPPAVEDPFVMVESPLVAVSSETQVVNLGAAACEFNHPFVQGQFSSITVDLLFKPLMAAVGVMRKDMALACGRDSSDKDWLSFFSSCGARETSRVMKIISRLYVAAASGDPAKCHQLILDLAEEGLVTGSETRLATPVSLRSVEEFNMQVDWHQLVGMMVTRSMKLKSVVQMEPAPILSTNNF